ncbi:FIVAR domain-containing protein [Bifidobacterium subtile]|uniref:Sugar-binding protein n=1 Tax=Bifidobacterium subtile TaxID=77635 RepID=A0A087E8V4_9BIFI|nr:FIVAR domain-containing protein [Bifidobacterium subtile]KFJ04205.1 hypothetical protein BISU_1243 [Bifidobacterium subtile]QOL36775.1 hypothetical protein BS3272_01990 [Bifidobacterium subtile]
MSRGEVHDMGLSFDFPVESEHQGHGDKPGAAAATLAFAAPDGSAGSAASNAAGSAASDSSISGSAAAFDAAGASASPNASASPVAGDKSVRSGAGFADAASAPASPDGSPLLSSIPAPPLASNDIVDTFWDIPAIDIPSPEAIAKREKIQARRQQRAASSKPALSGGLPLFPGGANRFSQAETESFAPKEFDFDSIISGSADALSAKKGSHKADPEEAPRSHAKQIIIAAVVLIVVIALAVGGILVWRQHKNTVEYRQAMDACNAAVGQYSKADVALSTVLRDTKSMQGITPDQVADANTVVKLRDAVAAANRISVASGCPTSVTAADLRANAKDAKRITAELKSGVGDITSAAKAVTASKAAKDAANAAAIQGNLKTATSDAQTLLDNSLYSVADNSTRVALEDAIKTANDLLGQNKPDTVAMQKALTGLQTASDSVKASMNDLVVQNQIAAQQQAQQQYLQQQYLQQQTQQQQTQQQQTPAQPVVPAPPADPNSSPDRQKSHQQQVPPMDPKDPPADSELATK